MVLYRTQLSYKGICRIASHLRKFFLRLRARGHSEDTIRQCFTRALRKPTPSIPIRNPLNNPAPTTQLSEMGWLDATNTPTRAINPNRLAVINRSKERHTTSVESKTSPLILHVVFHPSDPPRRLIQQAFRDTMRQPDPFMPQLVELRNQADAPLGTNRLIVAHHRPPNLADTIALNCDNWCMVQTTGRVCL